ncbi:T9SS type A sorting domain-containing protein [Psychroserpens mesophilus]|uniref:T9SS type A sorting domain-containing protein n=1 Tax=Psychroserpens mesophilus TaxID=325473 RepID=UPI000693537E|nr:T9SS type A sorting domain-containing protein [Psychroserpens mesophilus]
MKKLYITLTLIFTIQLSFGQIGFLEGYSIDNSNLIISISTADINNDGDLDILATSLGGANDIMWYENTGDQNNLFQVNALGDSNSFASSVYPSDLDNDGDFDVFVPASTFINTFKNTDGIGNFGDAQNISAEAHYGLTSDLDGDGDMDFITVSKTLNRVSWYKNSDGQGTFGTEQIITNDIDISSSTSLITRYIHVADIDGDNDMDILSASPLDDKVAWYENIDGLGNFSAEKIITTSADRPITVIAKDMDGDGDLDVVSGSTSDDKIAWYENTDGQGVFSSEQIITTSIWQLRGYVEVVDIDNDGDNDIFTILSNNLVWFENLNGDGIFSSPKFVNNDYPFFGANYLHMADINSDGKIDALVGIGTQILLFLNLGIVNKIDGTVTYDLDENDCDLNDFFVPNILISSTNNEESYSTFSLADGSYELFPNEGNLTTQIQDLPNYYSSNPISSTSNFSGFGNTDTVDFCIQPNGVHNDLNIVVYPSINDPRPGFDTTYKLVYNNIGTMQLSGSVSFEFDDTKLQFLNASETVSTQTSNTLTFDYTDLNPFETRTIDLEFNVFAPPITEIGDELISTATISPMSGDETEEDNVFELQQTVIGSYDPNDITCLEGEQILIDDVDKYLHYLIRFQNTGTASAINVRVENSLDEKLDWTTMQLESLSHTGRVEILNGSEVNFIFNNINLPDSTNDESNSHGYIAYKIKPKDNVVLGDIFYNTAEIYFDFNPPIVTNTYETEIVEEQLSLSEFEDKLFRVFPNPTHSDLTIESTLLIEELDIVDINGRLLKNHSVQESGTISINVSELDSGIYFLNIQAEGKQQTVKFIKN